MGNALKGVNGLIAIMVSAFVDRVFLKLREKKMRKLLKIVMELEEYIIILPKLKRNIKMGIYYFAVDYANKQQMWAPSTFADKCIYHPNHPLPHMIAMKNCQGCHFEIVNDVSTYDEHGFKDVTLEVYKELKQEFPDYDWDRSKFIDKENNETNQCGDEGVCNSCEDLGITSFSSSIAKLRTSGILNGNSHFKFVNKKTGRVHHLLHKIEQEEFKVDENGVKWKKVF